MNSKNAKSRDKFTSLRIKFATKEKAEAVLERVNKKKRGRKVKYDELFQILLESVTEEQTIKLQENSLTHEDRKEQLRERYIAINGPTSKEEFTGFMMKPEYFEFLKETIRAVP